MDNASETNTHRLNPPVNDRLDHVLGEPAGDITLVEYGSYNCPSCCAANEVIANLRDRFGERGAMYSATGLSPKRGCAARRRAGAQYAHETTGQYGQAHEAPMKRGPALKPEDFDAVAAELQLPPRDVSHEEA